MARKKKEVTKLVETEKPELQRRHCKSIPDESTFDGRVTLYDYSYGRSCRVDYNPYDYGFDFGNLSMDDF